jgi:hypothetical protein
MLRNQVLVSTTTEVEYLGYIITKEGIKPDPKKVQGIMDMARPTTTTEIR